MWILKFHNLLPIFQDLSIRSYRQKNHLAQMAFQNTNRLLKEYRQQLNIASKNIRCTFSHLNLCG